MNQKRFFIGVFSALACCLALVSPAIAESDSETNTTIVEEYDDSTTTSEPVVTSDDAPSDADTTETPNTQNQKCITNTDGSVICTDLAENELDNGTSGEAEVVCADENEPGCSQPETTAIEDAEVEPEIWPMILSLSALGITVVCIVVFNIIGHKKAKK